MTQHTEIITIGELANLLERAQAVQIDDIGSMRLYSISLSGCGVRVTHANGDEAVLFCSAADATTVLHAISKPLPLLTLVQGGANPVNA